MKTWKCDENGDVIVKRDIQMVEGNDEVIQQLRHIFGSNNGEWHFNPSYGLNYKHILGKNPIDELIGDEVRGGLLQCSETMTLDSLDIDKDTQKREMRITFEATAENGETISDEVTINA